MGDNFETSLKKSMDAYRRYVRPVIGRYISGKLIVIEGKTDDELAEMFDQCASIDIIRQSEKGLEGVASRIQFGHNWRTFTVRFKRDSGAHTEYEKLVYAYKNRLMCPKFTYQAYIENDALSGLAVVETASLLDYIEKHKPKVRHTGADQSGQASFYICPWDDIRTKGYKILEYKGEKWERENEQGICETEAE